MNASTEPPTSPDPSAAISVNAHALLTTIIAELCEVDSAQVGPEFRLASGRLRSSLGRATLDAKIRRRLGVKIENLHTIRTFGELQDALAGQKPRLSAPATQALPERPEGRTSTVTTPKLRPPSEPPSTDSSLACGVDVEPISALPEAKDYWEEPFYRTHFTAAEIAYCVSQPNPRMHFAARWCAKEAFKKCRPAYLAWDMNRIEVARRGSGSPYLQLLEGEATRTPPVTLSLTHTEDWALAVVIAVSESPPMIQSIVNDSSKVGRWVFVLSLSAFILSLLAFIRTLMHP